MRAEGKEGGERCGGRHGLGTHVSVMSMLAGWIIQITLHFQIYGKTIYWYNAATIRCKFNQPQLKEPLECSLHWCSVEKMPPLQWRSECHPYRQLEQIIGDIPYSHHQMGGQPCTAQGTLVEKGCIWGRGSQMLLNIQKYRVFSALPVAKWGKDWMLSKCCWGGGSLKHTCCLSLWWRV